MSNSDVSDGDSSVSVQESGDEKGGIVDNQPNVDSNRTSMIFQKFKSIRDKERGLRNKSLSFAKSVVIKPVKEVVMGAALVRPDAIAGVLLDAAESSAEEVGKAIVKRSSDTQEKLMQEIAKAETAAEQIVAIEETALAMIAETKAVTETAVAATRTSAEASIARLKSTSVSTILSIEVTANEAIAAIVEDARKAGMDVSSSSASAALSIGQERALSSSFSNDSSDNNRSLERVFTEDEIKSLSLQDVDFTLTQMAPPFIGEDQCLVPGEAIVRVEKAPDNSRRIFAGIDIMASVDDVWKVGFESHDNLRSLLRIYLIFIWSFRFSLIIKACKMSCRI